MKYTYVNKNAKGIYVEFKSELKDVKIGSTYEDYQAGKYVLLNEKQVAFKEDNPPASVKEVFDMKLTPTPPEPTLEERKEQLLQQLDNIYDNELNTLSGNGNFTKAVFGLLDETESAVALSEAQSQAINLKASYEALKAQIESATDVATLNGLNLIL